MSEVGKLLGSMIRRHRHRHGWTQAELGRRMSCSQTRISKVERGVVRIDANEREAFEQVFGLALGSLLVEIGRVETPARIDLELAQRLAALESTVAALRLAVLRQTAEVRINSRQPATPV